MARMIALTTTPPPETQAYLFHHRPRFGVFSGLNPFAWPWRGRPLVLLQLSDQTVRCTILGRRFGGARWLAARLGMPDLKERLKSGEEVTVFEFARNGYEIDWPKLDMYTLFEIGEPGSPRWTVSFRKIRDYSTGGSGWMEAVSLLLDSGDILREASKNDVRQLWRTALDPGAQHVSNEAH
jgi:hypothetical protein